MLCSVRVGLGLKSNGFSFATRDAKLNSTVRSDLIMRGLTNKRKNLNTILTNVRRNTRLRIRRRFLRLSLQSSNLRLKTNRLVVGLRKATNNAIPTLNEEGTRATFNARSSNIAKHIRIRNPNGARIRSSITLRASRDNNGVIRTGLLHVLQIINTAMMTKSDARMMLKINAGRNKLMTKRDRQLKVAGNIRRRVREVTTSITRYARTNNLILGRNNARKNESTIATTTANLSMMGFARRTKVSSFLSFLRINVRTKLRTGKRSTANLLFCACRLCDVFPNSTRKLLRQCVRADLRNNRNQTNVLAIMNTSNRRVRIRTLIDRRVNIILVIHFSALRAVLNRRNDHLTKRRITTNSSFRIKLLRRTKGIHLHSPTTTSRTRARFFTNIRNNCFLIFFRHIRGIYRISPSGV